MPEPDVAAAVARLDELTRRLRRECPWDREQDERSIVPHTVEEAYELADAANAGDDAKLLDELGDVLFQVHFLSLLLEERGAGDMAEVAEHCRAKLIRRHPHVFGDAAAETAGQVLRNWDAIKRTEPGREAGIFGDVPENLPALLHARKLQRRAASSGFDFPGVEGPLLGTGAELEELTEAVAAAGEVLRNWDAIKRTEPGREAGIFGDVPENLPALLHARKVQRRAASTGFDFPGVTGPLAGVEGELAELIEVVEAAGDTAETGAAAPEPIRDALFAEVGDLLFAAVNVARKLKVDPELALRSASARFQGRIETAEQLATEAGAAWPELPADHKLSFYAQARMTQP